MFTKLTSILLLILYFTTQAFAVGTEKDALPDSIVKQQIGGLLAKVADNKKEIAENRTILFNIVEEKLLPYVDIVTMARKTMGKYWRRASKEQKIAFAKAYRNTLLRYTSEAFDKYDNQEVTFIPLDDAAYKLDNVLVRTEINETSTGRPPIQVSFKFAQDSNKEWRVIDIYIEGVSMVLSKQQEYTQMISRMGIDATISDLEQKNAEALKPVATDSSSTTKKSNDAA